MIWRGERTALSASVAKACVCDSHVGVTPGGDGLAANADAACRVGVGRVSEAEDRERRAQHRRGAGQFSDLRSMYGTLLGSIPYMDPSVLPYHIWKVAVSPLTPRSVRRLLTRIAKAALVRLCAAG